MTKIQEASLFEILPFNVKNENIIEIKALSYALQKSIEMLCRYSDGTQIIANIDKMSEAVINNLTAEFNLPCFDLEQDLKIKKALVKDAFNWHRRAGTVSALKRYFDDITQYIVADINVQEWFEYDGLPYHFRIVFTILEKETIENEINNIESYLEQIKNARSVLDESIFIILLDEDDVVYTAYDESVYTDQEGNVYIL